MRLFNWFKDSNWKNGWFTDKWGCSERCRIRVFSNDKKALIYYGTMYKEVNINGTGKSETYIKSWWFDE